MRKLVSLMVGVALAVSGYAAALTAGASAAWNLNGSYTINFTCTSGCSGTYAHSMNVTSMNTTTGDFSGTGHYNADPSITWTVTGNVSGNNFNFTIDYDSSS